MKPSKEKPTTEEQNLKFYKLKKQFSVKYKSYLKMNTELKDNILLKAQIIDADLKGIAEKVFNGSRISVQEGVLLFERGDLNFLGVLANHVREKKNGISALFYFFSIVAIAVSN